VYDLRWIVIEGIDGSGKSTLAEWVRKYYEGRGDKVKVYVHPSNGTCGRIARHALESEGKVMHMVATVFYVADVLRSLRSMKHESKSYDTIVFVRYVMAATYLPERYVPAGYRFVTKLLPVPVRRMLIDVDPTVANERISLRAGKKEMFEDIGNLSKIRDKSISIAASNGWAVIDNSDDRVVTSRETQKQLERWDELVPVTKE
jgi:dTMP kinase